MIEAKLSRPMLFAVLTIACQLVGSLLVITDIEDLAWLGAVALGVFTLLCIPIAHPFWKLEEPAKTHSFHIALEHITVIGGLMLAASMSMIF